jgi:hypothetical protein
MMNAEHFAVLADTEALSKIEAFLFDETKMKFIFDPSAAALAGIYPEKSGDSTGRLIINFALSRLHQFLGLTEISEDKILSLLDTLSAQRKIKMLFMKIAPDNYRDLLMTCEIGIGLHGHREPRTAAGASIIKTVFYKDKPHDLLNGIAKPSLKASELRMEKDRDFEKRFPKIDAELQSKIRSEDRREEHAFKVAVLDLLQKIDRQSNESK